MADSDPAWFIMQVLTVQIFFVYNSKTKCIKRKFSRERLFLVCRQSGWMDLSTKWTLLQDCTLVSWKVPKQQQWPTFLQGELLKQLSLHIGGHNDKKHSDPVTMWPHREETPFTPWWSHLSQTRAGQTWGKSWAGNPFKPQANTLEPIFNWTEETWLKIPRTCFTKSCTASGFQFHSGRLCSRFYAMHSRFPWWHEPVFFGICRALVPCQQNRNSLLFFFVIFWREYVCESPSQVKVDWSLSASDCRTAASSSLPHASSRWAVELTGLFCCVIQLAWCYQPRANSSAFETVNVRDLWSLDVPKCVAAHQTNNHRRGCVCWSGRELPLVRLHVERAVLV